MLLSLPAQVDAVTPRGVPPVPSRAKMRRRSRAEQTSVQDWAPISASTEAVGLLKTGKAAPLLPGLAVPGRRVGRQGAPGLETAATVAVVGAPADLWPEVAALCEMVGARPLEVPNLHHPGQWWQQATGVIVDAAALAAGHGPPCLPRRERVAVLTSTSGSPVLPEVWQHALGLGAQALWTLPGQQQEMAHQIGQWMLTQTCPALTVGVIGGCGGVGTSTLAAALALTGSRRKLQTVLIDADPLGGGIDLLLGGQQAHGSRWPQLAQASGMLNPQDLREDLPCLDELFILSWDRHDGQAITGDAMRAVLGAAQRGSDLVVIDLPRYRSPYVDAALVGVDVCLLYVQATGRGVAAAGRVLGNLDGLVTQLRVVRRAQAHDRPGEADQLLQALGLPLAGVVKPDPSLAQALRQGLPPAYTGRGAVAQFCTSLLDDLFAHPPLAA